jgi:kinesin family protein 11
MSEKETNITVVVRVRPRNNREIKENQSVCVNTVQNQVEIKVPNCDTTKTYSFDKVFGPTSSQAQVFDQVVKGMLGEVLMGYNCTIFAYGQTGTGKTYTMEGDLSEPNQGSGIIPRTLYSLFDQLQDTMEYSVRVSVCKY